VSSENTTDHLAYTLHYITLLLSMLELSASSSSLQIYFVWPFHFLAMFLHEPNTLCGDRL